MIFPEGVTYDIEKDEFRTVRVNYVFQEIPARLSVLLNKDSSNALLSL